MATYYARNVTGNWASNTSWDSASSGGAGPAGPPVAGDTAIFDSGFTGTISLSAAAACTVLNCASAASGTLNFASYRLTVAGNVTLRPTMTYSYSGTAGITVSAAATISSNGATFGGTLTLAGSGAKTLDSNGTTWGTLAPNSGSQTITMASDVQATVFDGVSSGSNTFAGAFNFTSIDTMMVGGLSTNSFIFPSGQSVTVNDNLYIFGNPNVGFTVRSATGSSAFSLIFNGAEENCKVSSVTFSDVDASGSAQDIDNWNGGTLTRCSGITNRTLADFATSAQAGDIQSGTTISGISGTLALPSTTDVKNGVQYGAGGTEFTGSLAAGGGLITHAGMTGGMNG